MLYDKEMWSLFIATSDEEVIDMLTNENEDIKKAVDKLEYVSADRNERYRIAQIEKARIDHLAEMAANRDDGYSEGLEVGIEQGIEQGKIEMAKSLLSVLDDEHISKASGLTLEEVRCLRKNQV